ncbi:MAG: hypothetical protein OXG35_21875, partial [Acidobacteria bacterium]|nr:hypothetical protein [Acidobacteriota bacterium]
NVHRYGPGSGHFDSRRGWVTSYRFTPTMNGGAASFIVGDIAANVLAWRLQPPDGAKYAKSTLTGPDPRSWTRWLKVEAWNREKPQLLPEEARLDPTSAIDYVRTIPLFTDALRAVLELDASPPEACTTDKAVDLVRGDPWTPDPAIVADLSLMSSQQVIPSDPEIFPPGPERPNGLSHALQLSGDD